MKKIEYLCVGCLSNQSLIEYVKCNKTKVLSTCPICKSKNTIAVDISIISGHIAECLNHNYSSIASRDGIEYDPKSGDFYYIDTNNPVETTNICEILEDHCILSSSIEYNTRIEVYKTIFENVFPPQDIYTSLAEKGWSHSISNDLYYTWNTFN